jgi:ATP-dependent DNA ligase
LVPPAGPGWIHEIKHDGFRILAHRRGRSTRLFSRNGHNFADRFPRIADAIEALPVRSRVIDGEAIVCGDGGLPVFDLIRSHATNAGAVLCAFDLLEVNGEDIRREPIEDRKRRLLAWCGFHTTAFQSMKLSAATARSFIRMRARSAAKVSCQSGSGRPTALADQRTGSRSRTRLRRP